MELTKVYVVMADNYAPDRHYCYWTEGVFASEESAVKHISDEERRYDEDMRRIRELEKLSDRRRDDGTYDSFEKYGWTVEEFEEYDSLRDHWSRAWKCCPFYWIEEFEIKG